jgi:hypothetical protein
MVLLLTPLFLGEKFPTVEFENDRGRNFLLGPVNIWFENRRKSGQIVNEDIYLPFSLLFILWPH